MGKSLIAQRISRLLILFQPVYICGKQETGKGEEETLIYIFVLGIGKNACLQELDQDRSRAGEGTKRESPGAGYRRCRAEGRKEGDCKCMGAEGLLQLRGLQLGHWLTLRPRASLSLALPCFTSLRCLLGL